MTTITRRFGTVYEEAFRQPRFRPPQDTGSVAPEVGLFEALWEAGDVIPEFSFTALTDDGVAGHVTASRATVAADPVVAVGPIGVLPDLQGNGIGSALMHTVLAAADSADVPFFVLLGAPEYYSRFGFRPARGVRRDSSGAGLGRCLPDPSPDPAHEICGRTVSVRPSLLVRVARVTFPNTAQSDRGIQLYANRRCMGRRAPVGSWR